MTAATLDFGTASNRLWDCIVVGAGPAGALAAREVARLGATVLLVDRATFPRYKVCGGCLNPRALRRLDAVGLGQLPQALGAVPLERFRVATEGRSATIRIPAGAGLSRERLDEALVEEAVRCSVAFLPNTTAHLHRGDRSNRRAVRLRCGEGEAVAEARVVLNAAGLANRLDETANGSVDWRPGSRVGAGVMRPSSPGLEPGVIYMACGPTGYVGAAVVEEGQVDVAAALDPVAVKAVGGLGPLAQSIWDQAGLEPLPGLGTLPWKGTPYLTRRAPRLGAERLFVLGDAAGYVEPFTGEGMAWAVAGAAAVAPLVRQAVDGWNDALLEQWRGAYQRNVSRRQFICRTTASILRRPAATRVLVDTLRVFPAIARPVLHWMYRD